MAEKEYKDSASRDGYIITLYSDNSSKVERLFIQRIPERNLKRFGLKTPTESQSLQLVATHNLSERKS